MSVASKNNGNHRGKATAMMDSRLPSLPAIPKETARLVAVAGRVARTIDTLQTLESENCGNEARFYSALIAAMEQVFHDLWTQAGQLYLEAELDDETEAGGTR